LITFGDEIHQGVSKKQANKSDDCDGSNSGFDVE
jgi:hypothetical protein